MLLQLCPVLREAFEDVRADLLNLVKCKCSALSHLFPLLSRWPRGPRSAQGRPLPVRPGNELHLIPAQDEETGSHHNCDFMST